MLIRDINKLKPKTKELVEKGIELYVEKYKKSIWINETLRETTVQDAYYAQGRTTIDEVNKLRKLAGLWNITKEENTRTVTNNNGSSVFPHKYGIAIDAVPTSSDKPNWNAKQIEWEQIAECFKSVEVIEGDWKYKLEWGGDWKKFKDNPHFQVYRINVKTGELQNWRNILGV